MYAYDIFTHCDMKNSPSPLGYKCTQLVPFHTLELSYKIKWWLMLILGLMSLDCIHRVTLWILYYFHGIEAMSLFHPLTFPSSKVITPHLSCLTCSTIVVYYINMDLIDILHFLGSLSFIAWAFWPQNI